MIFRYCAALGAGILLSGLAAVTLVGCKHSYHENQLMGSWRRESEAANVCFTYFTNHTWLMTVTSHINTVSDEAQFGDWKIDGSHLVMVTRSSFDAAATKIAEEASLLKLNDSTLSFKKMDLAGDGKPYTFHRVNPRDFFPEDKLLSRQLVGTWQSSHTNSDRKIGDVVYSIYNSNGVAKWHGAIYKESELISVPASFGTWRVEQGCLVTEVTKSENDKWVGAKSKDEILFLISSQFVYRDDTGTMKKMLRVKTDGAQ